MLLNLLPLVTYNKSVTKVETAQIDVAFKEHCYNVGMSQKPRGEVMTLEMRKTMSGAVSASRGDRKRTRTLGGGAGLRQEHRQFSQNHQREVTERVGRNAGR